LAVQGALPPQNCDSGVDERQPGPATPGHSVVSFPRSPRHRHHHRHIITITTIITTTTSSPPCYHHHVITTTSSPPPRHHYHIITTMSPGINLMCARAYIPPWPQKALAFITTFWLKESTNTTTANSKMLLLPKVFHSGIFLLTDNILYWNIFTD
jgi:hypothetical protein